MSEFNKYSTDGGATFLDVEDSKAVHWGEQSKGYVGKNQLNYTVLHSRNVGITITQNADKSLTFTGTPSSGTDDIYLNFEPIVLTESIIITMEPSSEGSVGNTWWMDTRKIKNGTETGAGNYTGGQKTITPNDADSIVQMRFYLKSENTFNLTVKPMIRLASIPDSTYEPYLTPNTDLMSYKDNGVLGAKNLLLTVLDTFSTLGVTFTPNSDGTITANGKANGGTASFNLTTGENIGKPNNYLKLPKGKYILSDGTNDSSANTTYGMWIAKHNGNTRTDVARTNNGYAIFTVNGDEDYFDVGLMIRNGVTVTDKLFSPMIRLVSDPDATYQSPSKTNQELTNDAKVVYKDIQSQIAAKIGTQTGYSLSTSQMWEDGYRVDLCIWLTSVTQALSLNWNLSDVIPKALQRAGASVASREGNASGICWVNANETSLYIRIPAPSVTQEFIIRLTYYK